VAGKKVRNGTLVGLTVSGDEVADLLGVARESVPRWVREEAFPKVGYGQYPVRDCIRWYVERQRKQQAGESTEISEERRKLIVSQRIGQELANQKTRGELLDAAMVATAVQHMGALIATQLDGLAPRVSSQIGQLRDPVAIARVLADECRSIRRAASGAVAHFAGELVAVEDPRPAPKARRRRVGGREPGTAPGQSGAGAVAN